MNNNITKKDEIIKNVQLVLDKCVNPQLALHNGSIYASGLSEGVLFVKFCGACASCISSEETFQYTVKSTIMSEFPSIKDVQIDETVSSDLLDMAHKILNKNM